MDPYATPQAAPADVSQGAITGFEIIRMPFLTELAYSFLGIGIVVACVAIFKIVRPPLWMGSSIWDTYRPAVWLIGFDLARLGITRQVLTRRIESREWVRTGQARCGAPCTVHAVGAKPRPGYVFLTPESVILEIREVPFAGPARISVETLALSDLKRVEVVARRLELASSRSAGFSLALYDPRRWQILIDVYRSGLEAPAGLRT